ncbi:MAG TPA: hypothetical protein VIJ25_09220, partial [Methylococcales bacterium]
ISPFCSFILPFDAMTSLYTSIVDPAHSPRHARAAKPELLPCTDARSNIAALNHDCMMVEAPDFTSKLRMHFNALNFEYYAFYYQVELYMMQGEYVCIDFGLGIVNSRPTFWYLIAL